MPVKFFTIPFDHASESFHDDDVNAFMLKNSIMAHLNYFSKIRVSPLE